MKKIWILLLIAAICSGCASVWDAPKNVIGYSTRDIEAARGASSYQLYKTDLKTAFGTVSDILKDKKLYVLMQEESHGLIVVMGIPGVLETTEVGVFLTIQGDDVKVEVSSRSTPAKKTVALMLFSKIPGILAVK